MVGRGGRGRPLPHNFGGQATALDIGYFLSVLGAIEHILTNKPGL
jgi:hypothetical protein